MVTASSGAFPRGFWAYICLLLACHRVLSTPTSRGGKATVSMSAHRTGTIGLGSRRFGTLASGSFPGLSRRTNLRRTEVVTPKIAMAPPPVKEENIGSVQRDFDAMEKDAIVDDINEMWRQMRKRDLLKAAVKGEISKSQYVSQMYKKLTSPIATIGIKDAEATSEDAEAALAAQMEKGWEMRGFGNKYSRTVEIWAFVLKSIIKELRLKKIKDKVV
eukprot:970585-Amorphochlora_amoeboformis.AAC.2